MFRNWHIKSFLLVLIIGISSHIYATHIVGGEITYKCLGNNYYRIQLVIYQDCLNGEPTAISQDTPAYVGIFTGAGEQTPYWADSIAPSSNISVPANFNNNCVNNPPTTCLRKVTFIKDYYLPPSPSGYRFYYVRCCRNAGILNIRKPSETGATYFCDIPPSTSATCNNSAQFVNLPPQIICVNNPFVYDHHATDADGDSLSYEFCDSYPGGNYAQPKPFPTPFLPNPISIAPGYVNGFSAIKPMGGNPPIQIDPKTGIISGTPNIQGRFVVTVCCNEWRAGKIINTVKREFQFVVTNCSKAVVANIPQISSEFNTYIVQCKGKTVTFLNSSTGGFSYDWTFGVPGATSTDFQPEYTYPDTGSYIVTLYVNKGSTCPDSISRIVKVYPDMKADFEYSGLQCPNAEMSFTDLSDATYKPVNSWAWSFGDNSFDNGQNPTHTFVHGGTYKVTLVAGSVKGCVDTVTKSITIENFQPFAGNDTVIVKGEYINFHATGGVKYVWTPTTNLSFTDVPNPTGYYPDTGKFYYNVHITSVSGCQADDSLTVWVVPNPSLFVPSAFTPNNDGLNDYLRVLSAGYSKVRFFRVFNRFGQLVFDSNNFEKGWDGTFNGRKAEMGTYFWVLGVTDRFGQESMIKGDVTLIR